MKFINKHQACWAALWMLGLCGLACGAEDKTPLELRVIDVRELTTVHEDRPAPSYAVDSEPRDDSPLSPFASAAQVSVLGAPDLAQLIQDRLLAQDFADPATSIQESGGKLVIMQRPSVLKKIDTVLKDLEGKTLKRISVQALEIIASPKNALRWLGKAGQTVGEADLKAMLADGEHFRLQGAPQLNLFTRQQGHVLTGRRVTYLADADVSGYVFDPIRKAYLEGMVFEARASLNMSASRVVLNYAFVRTRQTGALREVDTAHYSMQNGGSGEKVTVREEADKEQKDDGDSAAKSEKLVLETERGEVLHTVLANHVRLQLPALARCKIQGDLSLRPGAWVLAGTGDALPGAQQKEVTLLLVRCEVVEDVPGRL